MYILNAYNWNKVYSFVVEFGLHFYNYIISMIGGGIWSPPKEIVVKLRENIAADPNRLRQVISIIIVCSNTRVTLVMLLYSADIYHECISFEVTHSIMLLSDSRPYVDIFSSICLFKQTLAAPALKTIFGDHPLDTDEKHILKTAPKVQWLNLR